MNQPSKDKLEKELTNSTPNSSKRDSFLIKDRSYKQEGRLSIETNDSFRASQPVSEHDNVTESQEVQELKESDHMINYLSQKILIDQLQYIKIDESQKSILLDGTEESSKVRRYLEANELSFKYCRLCETSIYRQIENENEPNAAQNAINEHF